MTSALATVIIVVSLLGGGYSLVWAYIDRPMNRGHLVALGLVEALLLVQAVLGVMKVADDQGPKEPATFLGYLIGILLIPAAGAAWGLVERSRWGPGVAAVAFLSVAAMIVRMNQIWEGTVV
ncbi:hypothetical protein [Spirillospora sp. CA-294931]|uniref:hypothetical protein n=1 Tax=Spirillospora sp. CA-294931 TaxID=3240042 RepID=UPI003D9031CA